MPSGAALPLAASCGVICLSPAMRSSTRSRRIFRRSLCSCPSEGSVEYGMRTAPASVAAWPSVSREAEVEKKRLAAASTPCAPAPK